MGFIFYRVLLSAITLLVLVSCSSTQKQNRCPASSLPGMCEGQFLNGNFSTNPLNSTMGFEFEGSVLAGFDYRIVALEIKSYLEKNYNPERVQIKKIENLWTRDYYKVVMFLNGKKYVFSIMFDVSLDFEDDSRIEGIEITSPILKTHFEASMFFGALNHLKKWGIEAQPNIGGNHTHFGVPDDLTFEKLIVLYKFFLNHFEKINDFFDIKGDRIAHFGRLTDAIKEMESVIKESPNTKVKDFPTTSIILRTSLRYVFELGTIELRFFNASTNPISNTYSIEFANRLFASWLNSESEIFDGDIRTIEEVLSLLNFSEKEIQEYSSNLLADREEYAQRFRPLNQEGLNPIHKYLNLLSTKVKYDTKDAATPFLEVLEIVPNELKKRFVGILLVGKSFSSYSRDQKRQILESIPEDLVKSGWARERFEIEVDLLSTPPEAITTKYLELIRSGRDHADYHHFFKRIPELFSGDSNSLFNYYQTLNNDLRKIFTEVFFKSTFKHYRTLSTVFYAELAKKFFDNTNSTQAIRYSIDLIDRARVDRIGFPRIDISPLVSSMMNAVGKFPSTIWKAILLQKEISGEPLGNVEELLTTAITYHMNSPDDFSIDFRLLSPFLINWDNLSDEFKKDLLIPFLIHLRQTNGWDERQTRDLKSAIESLNKRYPDPRLESILN